MKSPVFKEMVNPSANRFGQYGYTKMPVTFYRSLNDGYERSYHNIKVAIWVPENVGKAKCPALVKFHGGGLVRRTSDVSQLL